MHSLLHSWWQMVTILEYWKGMNGWPLDRIVDSVCGYELDEGLWNWYVVGLLVMAWWDSCGVMGMWEGSVWSDMCEMGVILYGARFVVWDWCCGVMMMRVRGEGERGVNGLRWKGCLIGKWNGGGCWSRNGERMERVVTIICFFCEWRFPVSFFSYLSCWVLWRGERKKGRYEREVKGFYCWHWMDWKVEGCIVWKSELGWISMNSLWVS